MTPLARRVAARWLSGQARSSAEDAEEGASKLTVTLLETKIGPKNRVTQTWEIEGPGHSVTVKTRTSDGDIDFLSKQDLRFEAFGQEVDAKSVIEYLIFGAPDRYYPAEGGTVELDKAFFADSGKKLSRGRG